MSYRVVAKIFAVRAFAEALDMKLEDLETALDQGKTMLQIAWEKGLTYEEFQKVMTEARQNAITQMVKDGVITQDQADWMLDHMQQGWGRRGGFGGCHGMGGGFGGSGRGGRWDAPPAQTTPSAPAY